MAMLLIFCNNYKGQELTYTLKARFGKLNKEKVLLKNSVQTSVESSETNTIFSKNHKMRPNQINIINVKFDQYPPILVV